MAANMPQMAPNGQQMMIPRQLQPIVYQALLATSQSAGWQAAVPIPDRLGKAMNLITNCILAAPGQEWQSAVRWGIDVEKRAFLNSPDRPTYESHIAVQVNEMAKKRQANAPDLQNQMSSEAARQSQLQAQQQQLLMNQMKGMGQPVQQGLQHLQHQMQPSPIPQQTQQQMGMGMGNPAMLQNRLNQQQFGMTPQQPRPPNSVPTDMNQLSPAERRTLQEVAQKLLNSTPEPQKAQQRAELMQKMNPQLLQEMQNSGRDPLLFVYQQKAFTNMQRQAQLRIMQQRGQGLPPNMDPAQAQAMLLQQQQRQMNQGMMNQLGQQPGMGDSQIFANMESIRNDQKAGLIAQQAGQVVVPASAAGARNPAQQAMAGLSLQNMQNNLQGQGQQPRQPQMTQQQQLQQQMAAQQARLAQVGGRSMQQPGGMQGPVTTSQSPGLTTLTAPMQQPPIPMTAMNGGPHMNPGNQTMGQPLGDPRFNQGNRQPMQQAILNHPMVKAMLNSITPEQRQSVSNMPPEKIKELVSKWSEQQRANMNGGAAAAKPPMGGMPGVPGQGPANQVNPMNQFAFGNPAQQAQLGAANVPQGMQTVNDVRFNNAVNTPGARNIMDSMDIPPPVLAQLNQMPLNMPPDTKKWGQLRNWMAQTPNPITPALRNQLNNFQLQQFRALLDRRSTMQGNGAQPGRPIGAQPPTSLPQQQPNQVMGIPPGVPLPPQVRQVTAQEIDNYRKSHPNVATLPNEMIHNMLLKLKADAWTKKYYESQGINRPPMGAAKPPGPSSQPPVMQPGITAGPTPVSLPQAAPQKQPPNVHDANAAKNARPPQQMPRPAQPNPSPATAQKGLKRPNPDESTDVQPQASIPAQPAQRPMSQADQRPTPQPTPEQLARMTPEQKAKLEQMSRNRQISLSNEDMNRLKTISAEEQKALAMEPMQDIQMSIEERNETIVKIQETVKNMSKIGRGLGRWYAITHDDSRARMFFKTRMRLIRQFADGDKMTILRDSFSIRSSELDTARNMMESMAKDLAAHFDIPKKQEANGAQTQQQQQPTPRAQPAPLNAANLEKQTQALNKMQHQRTASKSGPPPAPTTAQAQAQFGAQQSPTGQPTYLNKPAVTQDTLQLPPARKKPKTGPQQSSSPAVSAAGASPQIKAPSPEVKRLSETKTPRFVCPESDCDMHSTGFSTEEARKAHYHEEHVKPLEDPFKFVQDNLAMTLGLDPQGHPKAAAKNVDGLLIAAPPMGASLSKQGQTPMSKPDLASTPMSRDASMKRQGSMSGGKGPENMSTPGRSGPIKSEDTPKASDARLAGKQEPEAVQLPTEDPWASSTIDPQSLFASFAPLEPMMGGLSSDLSAYRSMTPNDTPESSKDSGASEPTSDISEGAQIDIDLNWQSIDADLLFDMNNVSVEGLDFTMDADAMVGDNFQFPSWDESEFSKSFHLDSSLFSMDATS